MKLSRKFALLALASVGLGIREWYIAWVLVAQPPELMQYVMPEALPYITFEVIFLIVGGLFLVGWPIAYRIQVIRQR